MSKENENYPDSIVMEPDTTYSPLFWDEEGVAIGDYDLFFIGDEEYSTASIEGLKDWFMQADKYDPFTDIAEFTTEGMEDWINQGYELAKQIRAMIPKEIRFYYGYWHQFGDGHWRCCKAYIAPEFERKYMFHVDLIHLETHYDDWYEGFPVSLTKLEFKELCDAQKTWIQTEEYKKWPSDGDEEYFIKKYCPSIHLKVREALKQFALNRWGEEIIDELFNADIYVPEEVWYINKL